MEILLQIMAAYRTAFTSDKLDSITHKTPPFQNICSDDISRPMTIKGLASQSFNIGEFSSPFKKCILVRGYADFYGGYAEHTRQVLYGLDNSGEWNIKLDQLRSPIDIDPVTFANINTYIYNDSFSSKGCLYLGIAGPGYFQKKYIPKTSRFNIGWTMVETLDVQPQIVEWLNNLDLVFTPTIQDFVKFRRNGVNNVEHMRIGYDDELFNSSTVPLDVVNCRNRYIFGVVGSWNHRKGVTDIVKAYIKAFNKEEPVTLMLVSKYGNRPYGEMAEEENYWSIRSELERCVNEAGYERDEIPHICVVDVPLYPTTMASLCARIDCLVGFSRGESTWLPGLEMGAMGKPIIQLASDCGGYMDYLCTNPCMCKKVEYKIANDDLTLGTSEYYVGQKLAFGNTDELRNMMQVVYKDKGSTFQNEVVNNIRKIVKDYTWNNACNKLKERLSIL